MLTTFPARPLPALAWVGWGRCRLAVRAGVAVMAVADNSVIVALACAVIAALVGGALVSVAESIAFVKRPARITITPVCLG